MIERKMMKRRTIEQQYDWGSARARWYRLPRHGCKRQAPLILTVSALLFGLLLEGSDDLGDLGDAPAHGHEASRRIFALTSVQ